METVSICPRFFQHELNNYYQWEKAFWRELIQNSIDEGCSQIQVQIEDTPSDGPHPNCTQILFEDNGPGMDENTLRNVYFQLGATTKAENDAIGGHGRARIITCFAHEKYTIKTQNLLCEGQGGSFTISRPPNPYQKGCSITILTKHARKETLEETLKEYLKTCQLPCSVLINKIPFQEWLHRRQATRTLTFGTIHTTKKIAYRVAVRVKGVTMFETHSGCPLGAILEIQPDISRQILTVSRDQLKYTQQRELDKFLQDISTDTKSLARDQTTKKTEIYGTFQAILPKPHPRSQSLTTLIGEDETNPCQFFAPPISQPIPQTIPQNLRAEELTQTHTIPPNANNTADYSLHYEDAPKELVRAAKKFQQGRLKGKRKKLLEAWDQTCRLMVQEVCGDTGRPIQYMPGFVFSPNLRGMHKKTQTPDGEAHILYLNPLPQSPSHLLDPKNPHTLFAIAAHEANHILHSSHNEDYAASLTSLIEKTLPQLPLLKKALKKPQRREKDLTHPKTTQLPS